MYFVSAFVFVFDAIGRPPKKQRENDRADSWERSLSHQTVVFVFVFVFYVLDTVDGDGDGDGDHLYICQRVRSHSVGAQ